MARQRNRAQQAQERANAEHQAEVDALRKDGRAWLIRAVFAVAFAAIVGFLLPVAVALGTIIALVCIGLSLRQGIRAQKLVRDYERAGNTGVR